MQAGEIERAPAARLDRADIRFRRAAVRLHRLGPRVLAELIEEIAARYLIRQPIEALVDDYLGRLDREMLRAVGGNRIPPAPIHLLPERGQ
jgi:hypothetical protein